MVVMTALEESRSFMVANGEQCAMIPGTLTMLLWCADSWDVEKLLVHTPMLILAGEVIRSCWMMWNVQEVNHPSHSVHTLLVTTVVMKKMQVSSAWVKVLCFTQI